MKLYYHKTDGGAEYLFDTGKKRQYNGKNGIEGVINDKTRYAVRIDGDIRKDAELTDKFNEEKKLNLDEMAKNLAEITLDNFFDEALDGDATKDLSKKFLAELNNLMGNE